MNQTDLQKQFLQGKAPNNLQGFYRGKLLLLLPRTPREHVANFLSHFFIPWKGKYFDQEKNLGDNILPNYTKGFLKLSPESIARGANEFGGFHAFPFQTAKKKGLFDPIDVLQLDYNLSNDPQRIRTITDELVETEKNVYLGKAHLKEGDSYRTVAFFQLRKPS